MSLFFQSVLTLLDTPTGSLAYHLILTFALWGALQASLMHWRSSMFPQGRRMVWGLSLLLAMRLGMFLAAGLAWQGIFDFGILLPLLDRAVILLSLIVIVWLWAFPEAVRMADAASLLIGLLTATLLVLGMVWWTGQGGSQAFNGSWVDTLIEILALTFIGIGLILLVVRRPNGWGLGVGMLLVLGAGHLAYLIWPSANQDFSSTIRLAELSAFPLLLALPQRFPLPEVTISSTEATVRRGYQPSRPEPRVLQSLLDLATGTDTDQNCRSVAATISQAMLADIALIVSPPDESGDMQIRCGYDLIREQFTLGVTLDRQRLPVLASALERGRPLRLPASSTSPDLNSLVEVLPVEKAGHLLAVPVSLPGEKAAFAILLLSSYSQRPWTREDQNYLTDVARPLAYFLQHSNQLSSLENDLKSVKDRLESVETERSQLQAELEVLRSTTREDQTRVGNLAAMIAAQEEAQEIIAQLQAENAEMRQNIQALPESDTAELRHLESELTQALEETARLKNALAQAEQRAFELERKSQPSDQPISVEMEEVAAVVLELRQPLSSILGYTDFLLGESVGILGSLQRKYLERIHTATERLNHLVNDLVRVTQAQEPHLRESGYQPVDLNHAIDGAIAQTVGQIRSKNIALRIDLPENLPQIYAASTVIRRVLVDLLKNAGSVTPLGGDIFLSARLEGGSTGQQEYVLLQLADEGGGIPQEHILQVFSTTAGDHSAEIPGVGESPAVLSEVKHLVESMGGRIWVDSAPGKGATYSMLLPVAPGQKQSSNGGSPEAA